MRAGRRIHGEHEEAGGGLAEHEDSHGGVHNSAARRVHTTSLSSHGAGEQVHRVHLPQVVLLQVTQY